MVQVDMNTGIMNFEPRYSKAAAEQNEANVDTVSTAQQPDVKAVPATQPVVQQTATKKKMSAGEIVALSALSATTLGGIIYGVVKTNQLKTAYKMLDNTSSKLKNIKRENKHAHKELNKVKRDLAIEEYKNYKLNESLDDLESRGFFARLFKSNKKHK